MRVFKTSSITFTISRHDVRLATFVSALSLAWSAAGCYRDDPLPALEWPSCEVGACADAAPAPVEQPAPPSDKGECQVAPTSAGRSLLITDPAALHAPASRTDREPWRFGARLSGLTQTSAGAEDMALAWLHTWDTDQQVPTDPMDGYAPRVAVRARPNVKLNVTCPWWKANAANQCDEACGTCRTRRLDMAAAPFELIAIVNRMDLSADADSCGQDGGEVRLVYTAIDPSTRRARPMTVILEYALTLPNGRDRHWYARQWQDLSYGPANTVLERLNDWLLPLLAPNSLKRVRTNEQVAGVYYGDWELRQFVPYRVGGDDARLLPTTLPHTPALSFMGTTAFVDLLERERSAILTGDNRVPRSLWAGAADVSSAHFAWTAAGVDPVALSAFNNNTCNGCHGRPAVGAGGLGFQHIAPTEDEEVTKASARLSFYLHKEQGQGPDELSWRTAAFRRSLCNTCGRPSSPPPHPDAGGPGAVRDGGDADALGDACGP